MIEKLYHKFKNEVNIAAIFTKRFRSESELAFPYAFLPRLAIECKSDRERLDKNFFLITKDRLLKDYDRYFDIRSIYFSILKNIDAKLDYPDFAIPPVHLKKDILKKVKEAPRSLLNLNSGKVEKVGQIIGTYDTLYFFHANCSSCQLKSFASKIRLEQTFDESKAELVIFSVLADRYKLLELFDEVPLEADLYLDIYDEFELFSVITDEKENPFTIPLDKEER